MRKLSFTILIIFLLFYSGCIVYFNRANFFTPYDVSYWQERFEQSQWRLRFTDRTIGDDGLYAYQGYTYIKGADPTASNAEAPPLGKYLIGWSITVFNNPYWTGMITIILSLVVFYLLARTILPSSFTALIATIIFALDPLIIQQATVTMLDAGQLFFILLFFLLFFQALKKQHGKFFFLWIILSGMSLGSFSSMKFPVLTPIFICIALFVVWKKKIPIIPFFVCFFGGLISIYLLSYARYFQAGHNLLDWLKVQKWMLSFYQASGVTPNYGSAIVTLLFNQSQNFFTRKWELQDIWSPAWPAITTLFFMFIKTFWNKRETLQFPVIILSLSTLLLLSFYCIIPFWTRYLILLLPFLYLVSIKKIVDLKKVRIQIVFFTFLFLVNSVASFLFLFPTPQGELKQFLYDWEHGYFNDMYERLDSSSKTPNRTLFHRTGQIYWGEGEIETAAISAKTDRLNRFSLSQQIPVSVTYKTRFLGSFTEEKILTVVNQRGEWKFQWSFSDLITGLQPGIHLTTTIEPAIRGSIFENKELRAEDFLSFLVSITPKNIDTSKEQEMLTYIQNLFKGTIMAAAIHDRYIVSREPDLSVAIGVLPSPLSTQELQMLLSYPGVAITPEKARWHMYTEKVGEIKNTLFNECCSYLYSTNSYDGISGLEKQHNDILKGYNGGLLQIVGADGNIIRTIIEKEKIDGKEVAVITESR